MNGSIIQSKFSQESGEYVDNLEDDECDIVVRDALDIETGKNTLKNEARLSRGSSVHREWIPCKE